MLKMSRHLTFLLLLMLLIVLGLGACGPANVPGPAETPPTEAPGNPDTPDDSGTPEKPSATVCRDLPAEPDSYYLSPNGDDSADGRSPATAWQTLARLQQAVPDLGPGESVLLERGAIFPGSLNLNGVRGEAGRPVRLGSYCEGAAPLISGFTPLADWREVRSNVWETDCPDCPAEQQDLNLLRLSGELQPLARWPNADADNEGYLTYDSFSNRTELRDDKLAGVDWSGAEVVVRTRPWILDRVSVLSSAGGTLRLGAGLSYDFWDEPGGSGYFMQNHPAALDRHGEWVFSSAQGKLRLYHEGGEPAQVELGTVPVLLSLDNAQHIQLFDLVLEGALSAAVSGEACHDIRLSGVELRQSGTKGVFLTDCEAVEITASRIAETFDNALTLDGCRNCLVTENELDNIATVAGMGQSGNGRYLGVLLGGPDTVFEYNTVQNVGYVPVTALSNTTVRYNVIDNFHLVKIDGGGVYTYAASNVNIHHNLISNGIGSKIATPWDSTSTNGIYIDQRTRDSRIYANVISYTSGSGIKIHSSENIDVEANTVFAASEAATELIEYVEPGKLLNNTVKDNLFVTETSADYLIAAPTPGGREYFENLGVFKNNVYCAPFANPFIFQPWSGQGANQMFVDLATWQRLHGQDEGSSLCQYDYAPYEVSEVVSDNLIPNGGFAEGTDGWFTDLASTTLEVKGGQLELRLGQGEGQDHLYAELGALTSGAVYRLSFEAAADGPTPSLKVRLRDNDPEANFWDGFLTPLELISISDETATYEVFFKPERDEANARLSLGVSDRDVPVYLDNLELVEVEAKAQSFEERVMLEVNPEKTSQSLQLKADYQDITGKLYSSGSSVTLEPYGSLVLFRRD